MHRDAIWRIITDCRQPTGHVDNKLLKRMSRSLLYMPALLAALTVAVCPAAATDLLAVYTVNYPLQ